MKRIVMIALISSACAIANDVSRPRISDLLAQNSTATELNWQNRNLTNEDLADFKNITAPSIKFLNLSNNCFRDCFPLATVLRCCTNLEKLTVSNNTAITEFELEDGFTNNKLKTLEAENTGFETVDLNALRPKIRLNTLDLSRCTQLKKFILFGSATYSDSDYCLHVHIRDVVIPVVELNAYSKAGVLDSKKANNIKNACAAFSMGLVGVGILLGGYYFPNTFVTMVKSPIALPEDNQQAATGIALANIAIWSAPPIAAAAVFGDKCVGSAIAYCLPNHGKVTAIKFITNSTENV